MIVSQTIYIYPTEELVISINFTGALPTGITLTGTPSSNAIVLTGRDNPENCLNGLPSIASGNLILNVPVKGSVDWTDYIVTAICPTTNPKIILVNTIWLKCRAVPDLEP